MKYILKFVTLPIIAILLLIGFTLQSGAGFGIKSVFSTPANIIFILLYFASFFLISKYVLDDRDFNRNAQFSTKSIIIIFLVCNIYQYKEINKHEVNIITYGYEETLNKRGCGRSLITANSLFHIPFGNPENNTKELINMQATSLSFSMAHKKNPMFKQLIKSCNDTNDENKKTCVANIFIKTITTHQMPSSDLMLIMAQASPLIMKRKTDKLSRALELILLSDAILSRLEDLINENGEYLNSITKTRYSNESKINLRMEKLLAFNTHQALINKIDEMFKKLQKKKILQNSDSPTYEMYSSLLESFHTHQNFSISNKQNMLKLKRSIKKTSHQGSHATFAESMGKTFLPIFSIICPLVL